MTLIINSLPCRILPLLSVGYHVEYSSSANLRETKFSRFWVIMGSNLSVISAATMELVRGELDEDFSGRFRYSEIIRLLPRAYLQGIRGDFLINRLFMHNHFESEFRYIKDKWGASILWGAWGKRAIYSDNLLCIVVNLLNLMHII
jgi:hypothetical protein